MPAISARKVIAWVVYAIHDLSTDEIVYIGSTKNLLAREGQHRAAIPTHNMALGKWLKENRAEFRVMQSFNSEMETRIAELKLLHERHPRFNRQYPTSPRRTARVRNTRPSHYQIV